MKVYFHIYYILNENIKLHEHEREGIYLLSLFGNKIAESAAEELLITMFGFTTQTAKKIIEKKMVVEVEGKS